MRELEFNVKKAYMRTFDDFWKRLTSGYEDKIRYSLIMQELSICDDQNFLDVGCGTGVLCIYAALTGAKVVGLDISRANLVNAKDMVKSKNLQSCSFILGDIDHLPFKENIFYKIVCTEVLEHFINPNEALKEISRVSKRGTEVFMTVPNLFYPWRYMGRVGLSMPERIRLFLYGIRNGYVNESYYVEGRKVAAHHRAFNPIFFRNYISRYFKIKKFISTLKWRSEFLPYIPISLQKFLSRQSLNNILLKYFGLQILCVAIKIDVCKNARD